MWSEWNQVPVQPECGPRQGYVVLEPGIIQKKTKNLFLALLTTPETNIHEC
jgi:hypothetical protein